MGIINATPDSFYEKSRAQSEEEALSKATQMLEEGADFLDIGGYSTRPGAAIVSVTEELDRVLPTIEIIKKAFPTSLISIDTFRAQVARTSIASGADWVNDISGGLEDSDMLSVVAQLKVPYIQMHMRKTTANMHEKQTYTSVAMEVAKELNGQIAKAQEAGIVDIVADPGFGFSKNAAQNFQLLNELELLQTLEKPIMIGLSRKSLIYKTLDIEPEEAVLGTNILHTIALMKGVHIFRVHDVKPTVQTIQLWKNVCLQES